LLLKKLDIYNKEGDWLESNKLAEYLFDRYSSDAFIRSTYLDYKLTLARQYSHRGYIEIAKRAYESVLEQDPLNKEALQAVFSLDVRSGNYESSLAYTNRALQSTPNSYEFLKKKLSILEAMSRYVEAIAVCEKLMKLFPADGEIQKLNIYLRMEAGHYYMNTDPYLQFQAVLDKDPSNRDALNYVINIAQSRGLLTEALNWENAALKKYPNDRELLIKKMGTLENLKNYGKASVIAETIYKSAPNQPNKENFVELRTLAAKAYINDMEYDSALIALKSVLFYDHANIAAINYSINAYSALKRYDDAIHVIDEGLTYYPGDERLLYKKAGVLEAYQKYADAALISKQLLQRYPESRQYLVSFVEQSLEASRQSMQYDDYLGTIQILQEVLDKQPDNMDALNYVINLEDANKQFDSALYYCDLALHYFQENKDFLLKKSSVLADARRFQEAYAISGALHNNYPYNIKFRNIYTDQLIGSGWLLLGQNKPDSALTEFYKALDVEPNDTTTLYYVINTQIAVKAYDSALGLINRGRMLYPEKPFFLQKRAVIYELQMKWSLAWRSADTLVKMNPNDTRYQDYYQYLYSRGLKNEIGLFYLHSKIVDSSNSNVNNIATIQYSRRIRRGTITARINYAGRFIGTGFQFEGEIYYNHTPKWYSFAVAAYSPNTNIFPKYRLGYSLFHSFPHGWDAEIGIRYLKADSGTIYSLVGSVAKEIKDFYLNLRGYYIERVLNSNATSTYYSVILTSRYYLDERRSYFTAIAGYGTAPDDFSLNYELTKLLAYNTVSCGAGYSRQIQYRTTLGIFGTWYNEKTGLNKFDVANYQNQYDIYVTLLRRF
jgi:YaiO family outer membrane protein